MTQHSPEATVAALPARISVLASKDRTRVERIFHVSVARGETVPPTTMHKWIRGHFGSQDAVTQQQIVRVTNKVTLEGTLFNALRAQKPIEAPAGIGDLGAMISASAGGPFCDPVRFTPADVFGRIQGRASVTASNAAKYDAWHAVIIFDEHAPLRFTADQVADYLDTAQNWARQAHRCDPEACYPFFLWNCLWRSGASIIHGHAQMTVARSMHYARIEAWRQAAARYRAANGADYFSDLIAVHSALGLAVPHGTAAILPSLTPFKEQETYIVARALDDDLKTAVFRVLDSFIRRLGTQSFNLALYQPPLCPVAEDWEGFPHLVRILDRGRIDSRTSDIGAMEIFAESVVATDPYRVADALRPGPGLRA